MKNLIRKEIESLKPSESGIKAQEINNHEGSNKAKVRIAKQEPSFKGKHVALEPHDMYYLLNSKIGFSTFPLDGNIQVHIMKELGLNNIVVKELRCWKFMFTLSSLRECDLFDWKKLKDWIVCVRKPCEEDLLIKRKSCGRSKGFASECLV